MLPLFPRLVTSAQGRLDGELSLPRRRQRAPRRGPARAGALRDVLLKPTPGLLTRARAAQVRETFLASGDLRAGRVPVRAEVLEISSTRRAMRRAHPRVRLAGGPVDPGCGRQRSQHQHPRPVSDTLVKFGTNSHWGRGNKR